MIKKNIGFFITAIFFFASYGYAAAAPPVCPSPSQGYEIAGCFADTNGDEWSHGGTVEVYDPIPPGYSTGAVVFSNGTFVVDAFSGGEKATPAEYNCNAGRGDFYVVVTFNDGGAGTPATQNYCVNGETAVNGGGYDLTTDNGGNPYSTGTGPTSIQLSETNTSNGFQRIWLPLAAILLLLVSLGTIVQKKIINSQ
ncbi:MAG: hypothetical protein QNJ45_22165 [Ardenticatenaceae bacterium]|nr:hypothetical protein [Ardenticatenaceae bacterium]